MEARERGLKMMKDRAKQPFKYMKEYEEHRAQVRRRELFSFFFFSASSLFCLVG
jgi:hypothetical protein